MLASRIKVTSAVVPMVVAVAVAVAVGGLGVGHVAATAPAAQKGTNKAERKKKQKPPANPQEAALQETLFGLEKAGYEALKGKNRDAAYASLADDFVGILVDDGRLNRAEFIEALAEITLTSYTLSNVDLVPLSPDAAILTYRAKTAFIYEGKAEREALWVSSGWARRNEKWVNVFYQETADD